MKKLLYQAVVYAEHGAAIASQMRGMACGRSPQSADAAGSGPYEILNGGAVLIEDGKIAAVYADEGAWANLDISDCELIDLDGRLLVPGFVDVHVHGGGGYDVMRGDVSHIQGMSRFHATHGTTTILPTTLTAEHHRIERAIAAIVDAIEEGPAGADIAGIHLEGPYISPDRCGAQHPEYVRDASIAELDRYIRLSEGRIRLITIAPERPQALELIRYAAEQGITVSLGHTDATWAIMQEAVRQGASHVTHLFNGMRPLHHREPGAAGAALMLDELTVELICDGHHVHPDLIRFVHRVKPQGKIVLITDAMEAAGLPDGEEYQLGGLACFKRDGQVRLKSRGDLAGSCLTMDAALRNALRFTGSTLAEILPMLTINPARQAGIAASKGSIAPGKDADLTVLDDDFQVRATYVKGKRVYG